MSNVPFADEEYYIDNFGPPPESLSGRLESVLGRASRYVRSEYPDIDERIAEGAVDPDLVADVVCEMVRAAAASPAGIGVASVQQGAGPYQQTTQFVNPVGDLYLSKKHRRLLGYGKVRAFEVNLLVTEEDSS